MRLFCVLAWAAASTAMAVDMNVIGVTPLRAEDPTLTGSGIPVGQSEAPYPGNLFEVNPSATGQPVSLFTWISSSGTATTYPNSVGGESPHADSVGSVFYGTSGVAPGVQHVRNYEAGYYWTAVVKTSLTQPERVMNNSWVNGVDGAMDLDFDNYAAAHDTLFVSGMNNSTGTPESPGSCFNGIGVGRSEGPSSIGPTADGRAKPDIVLPGFTDATSFVTPAVAGSAAVLLQAAIRNDGGPSTAALATNSATIKALLLNGAIKPVGWTNSTTYPLDARWGTGNLNLYNSYQHLKGGRAAYVVANTVGTDNPHPPVSNPTNITKLRGWDYNTLTSDHNNDAITHYLFQMPSNGPSIGVATLVWKKALAASSVKNLDLYLYSVATSNLIASSLSVSNNVEHLFATNLPPGRYDLQVLKRGGALQTGSQSYALAWDFVTPVLRVQRSAGAVTISWPINEAGLVLQSTTNLVPPIQWQTVSATPTVTNSQNVVTLSSSNSMEYFRLLRP